MTDPKAPDSTNAAAPVLPPEIVPEELLNKLHDANERFSTARHHRENAIDSATPEEYEHDAAAQELRDAEKCIEEVTKEIDCKLHPPR